MQIEKHQIKTRAQWLELRRQDLTASDIGAYLGLTPWKSPAELFAEKLGMTPQLENENRVLRRGRRDEYAILRVLAEERPDWTIKEAKVYVRCPELRLGCTPDAVAEAPGREGFGIVQCKSVALDVWRSKWLDGADDDAAANIPVPYHLQTLCERMLCGADWSCLAVWVRSAYTEDLKIIDIDPDPVAEQNIKDLAVRFWQEIEAGKIPEFDHKRDDKIVELFYPKATDDERDLSSDNEACQLVAEYVSVRDQIKALDDRKKELAAALKVKLGTFAKAKIGDYTASWKEMTKAEHLVEAWTGRVLRVTAPRKTKESTE